jgi:hypothetical protein
MIVGTFQSGIHSTEQFHSVVAEARRTGFLLPQSLRPVADFVAGEDFQVVSRRFQSGTYLFYFF